MIELLREMFSQSFIVRTFIIGILVSLCASLLGVNLVLKRYSMIGDGLSHVSFGALAIACAANIAPLKIAIPVVIIAAFLLLKISENSKIKGDAAIALISTGSLAIGSVAVSLSSVNIDVSSYLFGSIFATSKDDIKVTLALSIIVLVLYVLFYNKIFAITFDENFAQATGTNAKLYNIILALLTALTVVIGMRLMGALLISALIIFPSLTSMRLFKRFRSVVIVSAFLAVICFVVGICISFVFNTPAGASVVIINIIAFCSFSLAAFLKSVFARK